MSLKFILRIFLKDKFFSILNIVGLALGIAVSMVLVMILKNDLSYDKHYANHEKIYRLGSHYAIPDVDAYIGVTARELAPVLKQNYPEIEQLVRLDHMPRELVKGDNGKKFYEEEIQQTDPTYFKVFNHTFISGDVNTCLNDPKSVVLTRSMATKYFDGNDPIGKILTFNKVPRVVTAVIEDLPFNTHLKFDFLISGLTENRPGWDYEIKNGKPEAQVMWSPDVITYLLLPENYNVNNFYDRFKPIYNEYFTDFEDYKKDINVNDPILEPLASVHFSKTDDNVTEFSTLMQFTFIGALIVLLACINYMNLSTAKAIHRATEITMKRLAGSTKGRLIRSLLSESVLLSMVSLFVAIGIVYSILGPINAITNRNISLDILSLVIAFFIALIIGILSGIYPAFYLTNIPVIATLKGKFKNSRSALLLRRSLITVQFSISIFVVICTLFMSSQLNFIRTKSLGFNKDNLLVVPLQDTLASNAIPLMKNEFAKDRRIITASASAQVLGMGEGVEVMYVEGPNGMEQRGFITAWVDDGYLDMMGIELLKGRTFAEGKGVETEGYYLANEAAVKLMNWGDDAIGKKVEFFGHQNPGKVIGIFKDFNASSLYIGVDPMIIIKGHWRPGNLQVKLTGEDIPGAIEAVKQQVTKYDSEHPFEYFFLDQKYDEQYKADINRNQLLAILSYVCVFISLLGLLGLSAFSAVQRTKEIGIRKVLGANLAGVLVLLSKDIVLLVFLASAIAMPLGWHVIDGWLEGFAYRAPFNYWLMATIMFAAMMFVIVVTAFQSWKTVTANPVDSLKYE